MLDNGINIGSYYIYDKCFMFLFISKYLKVLPLNFRHSQRNMSLDSLST